ncbi:MAG TPA: sulfatase [Myxococcota bacterium]
MSSQRARSADSEGTRGAWRRIALAWLAFGLAACGASGGEPRNVVLLVIDTLRADHLGLYGYERPTSPQIDAWAARGAVFDRAMATSPWTLPSFGSLFTGQLPSRHTAGFLGATSGGERGFVTLDASVRSLAEILGEAGYATVAIANNPFLDPEFEISRGFEVYDHEPGSEGEIRRANAIVDRAFDWLDHRSDARPFLMLVHFFDPHINYDPPDGVRGRFAGDYAGPLESPISDLKAIRAGRIPLGARDRAFIVSTYDEEILFVDAQAGRLLAGLRSRGCLEDTIVVLVSDHGEEFWDHGGFEHGHSMFQELLRVPMIVWGPGIPPQRIAEPVSIADVFPTALEALGLPAVEALASRSLWGVLTRGEAPPVQDLIAEGNLYGPEHKSLIRWPHKLVFDVESRRAKLFDLEADPSETRDIAAAQPALAKALLSALDAQLREASLARMQHRAADLDESTKEKLRALGYLD